MKENKVDFSQAKKLRAGTITLKYFEFWFTFKFT